MPADRSLRDGGTTEEGFQTPYKKAKPTPAGTKRKANPEPQNRKTNQHIGGDNILLISTHF